MIKTIQALRFYIIVLIFITHLFFIQDIPMLSNIYTSFFNNGALGVTFFFILSGFVIRLGYGDKFNKITFKNYFSFIKKRITKIYPLYFFTMFFMFIYFIYINNFKLSIFIYYLKRFLLCIPMLQSLIPIQNINQLFNGAAWFISTLFILYFVTPFLLHINKNISNNIKKSIFYLIVIYTIYIILSFLITKYVPKKYEIGLVYCSPYLRIFQYIIGIILGNIYLLTKDIKIRISFNFLEVFSILIFIICYLFSPLISKSLTNYLNMTYLSTTLSYSKYIISSIFVIYIFSFQRGVISHFLMNKYNLFLGDISFYIYIIHLPLIEVSLYFVKKYGLFISPIYYFLPIIYFILTIILSILYKNLINKYNQKKE